MSNSNNSSFNEENQFNSSSQSANDDSQLNRNFSSNPANSNAGEPVNDTDITGDASSKPINDDNQLNNSQNTNTEDFFSVDDQVNKNIENESSINSNNNFNSDSDFENDQPNTSPNSNQNSDSQINNGQESAIKDDFLYPSPESVIKRNDAASKQYAVDAFWARVNLFKALRFDYNKYKQDKLEKEKRERNKIPQSLQNVRLPRVMKELPWVFKERNYNETERLTKLYLGAIKVSKRNIQNKVYGFSRNKVMTRVTPLLLMSSVFIWKSGYLGQSKACDRIPGLARYVKKPSKLSLETVKAINLLNKMDWRTHKQINYFPGSTFIFCHPELRLLNDRFYNGVFFNSGKENFKRYITSTRHNNVYWHWGFINKYHKALCKLDHLKGVNQQCTSGQLRQMRYFQQKWARNDCLPSKTNHIFSTTLDKNPLFRHLKYESQLDTTDSAFMEKLKLSKKALVVSEHDHFTGTHLQSLRKSLVEADPCANKIYKGCHRLLQYKNANNVSIVKELLKLHIHTGEILEVDEDQVEVEFYFDFSFSMRNKLEQFKEIKNSQQLTKQKQKTRKVTKGKLDYNFRSALQEDLGLFKEDEHEVNDFVEDSKHGVLSSLYDVKKPNKCNPFHVIYQNQLTGMEPPVYSILPNTQTVFDRYVDKQLRKQGLTAHATNLAYNLNPAIKPSLRIKAIKLRRSKSPSLAKTKRLKHKIIKADSDFLKRIFSGYLFPDLTMDEIFLQQLNWKNRWFVHGKESNDEVLIQIEAPPELNYWLYRKLCNQQTTDVNSTEQIMADTRNFAGVIEMDYGVTFQEKLEYIPKKFKYRPNRKPIPRGLISLKETNLKFDERTYTIRKDLFDKAEYVNAHKFSETSVDDNYYASQNQRCLPLPYNSQIKSPRSVQIHQPHFVSRPLNINRFVRRYNRTVGKNTNAPYLSKPKNFFGHNKRKSKRSLTRRRRIFEKVNVFDPMFLGQIALICYVFMGSRKIYFNYSDSFYRALEKFLDTLNLKDLTYFNTLEDFVWPPSKLTFSDVIAGPELFDRLRPTIFWLRSRRSFLPEINPYIAKYKDIPVFSWHHMFDHQKYIQAVNDLKDPESNIEPVKYHKQGYFEGNQIPKGILFVGTPGTGKTYLVKALSGETHCPIITDSNVDHTPPGLEESDERINNLRKLFKTAKFHAPCILFLDELDSIGQKRNFVLGKEEKAAIGPNLFYSRNHLMKPSSFRAWQQTRLLTQKLDLNQKSVLRWSITNPKLTNAYFTPRTLTHRFDRYNYYVTTIRPNVGFKPKFQDNVETVTLLLCELDGLGQRANVVVVGATNRPKVLDPALIRPGRLGEILYLDLPSKQKRLNLLRYYGKNFNSQAIDWEFFANHAQTGGLSPAHLKVALNISAMTLIKKALDSPRRFDFSEIKPTLGHTNLSVSYGIQSVKYQNMHVIPASRRLRNGFYRCIFSNVSSSHEFYPSDLFNLQKNPNAYFVIDNSNIRTRDVDNPCYVISNLDGIHVPTPFDFDPAYDLHPDELPPILTADVSAPKPTPPKPKPKPPLEDEFAQRIYDQRKEDLRLQFLLKPYRKPKNPFAEKKGIDYFEFLVQDTENETNMEIFQNFKRYSERAFQPHLFGLRLLMDSPYIIRNPLMFRLAPIKVNLNDQEITSNFNWAHFNNKHVMDFNYIKMANSSYQSQTLFDSIMQKNRLHMNELQQQWFGDSLGLQRSIYYTAGKAVILSLLKTDLFDGVDLNVWNNIKSLKELHSSENRFIQNIAGQLITKSQFENYLLALIAGKVGEHFLLASHNKKNYSNLGMDEILKMNWISKIMVENGLLYSSVSSLTKLNFNQPLITSRNDIRSPSNPVTFGKPVSDFKNQNTWNTIPHWWQSKLKYENKEFSFEGGCWYSPFSRLEDITSTPIYHSNTLNNHQNASWDEFQTTAETIFSNTGIMSKIHASEDDSNVTVASQEKVTSQEVVTSQENVISQEANSEEKSNLEKVNENIDSKTVIKSGEQEIQDSEVLEDQESEALEEQENETLEDQEIQKSVDTQSFDPASKKTEYSNIHSNISKLNKKEIASLVDSVNFNWNSFDRTKSEAVFIQLIRESCNKAFAILEKNRALLDFYVYELQINNQLTVAEAKKLTSNFLNLENHIELSVFVNDSKQNAESVNTEAELNKKDSDSDSDSNLDSNLDFNSDSDYQSESESESELKSELESESESELKSEPESELKSDSESELKSESSNNIENDAFDNDLQNIETDASSNIENEVNNQGDTLQTDEKVSDIKNNELNTNLQDNTELSDMKNNAIDNNSQKNSNSIQSDIDTNLENKEFFNSNSIDSNEIINTMISKLNQLLTENTYSNKQLENYNQYIKTIDNRIAPIMPHPLGDEIQSLEILIYFQINAYRKLIYLLLYNYNYVCVYFQD